METCSQFLVLEGGLDSVNYLAGCIEGPQCKFSSPRFLEKPAKSFVSLPKLWGISDCTCNFQGLSEVMLGLFPFFANAGDLAFQAIRFDEVLFRIRARCAFQG